MFCFHIHFLNVAICNFGNIFIASCKLEQLDRQVSSPNLIELGEPRIPAAPQVNLSLIKITIGFISDICGDVNLLRNNPHVFHALQCEVPPSLRNRGIICDSPQQNGGSLSPASTSGASMPLRDSPGASSTASDSPTPKNSMQDSHWHGLGNFFFSYFYLFGLNIILPLT